MRMIMDNASCGDSSRALRRAREVFAAAAPCAICAHPRARLDAEVGQEIKEAPAREGSTGSGALNEARSEDRGIHHKILKNYGKLFRDNKLVWRKEVAKEEEEDAVCLRLAQCKSRSASSQLRIALFAGGDISLSQLAIFSHLDSELARCESELSRKLQT